MEENDTSNSFFENPVTLRLTLLSTALIFYLYGWSMRGGIFLAGLVFFVYLAVAIHGITEKFSFNRICGFDVAVVWSFFIGLTFWVIIGGDILDDSASVGCFIPFLVPVFAIPVIQSKLEKIEDEVEGTPFIQGLFIAIPVSICAVMLALTIVSELLH